MSTHMQAAAGIVSLYIYIYMHACMHACMQTYIHTYIHTYIQTDNFMLFLSCTVPLIYLGYCRFGNIFKHQLHWALVVPAGSSSTSWKQLRRAGRTLTLDSKKIRTCVCTRSSNMLSTKALALAMKQLSFLYQLNCEVQQGCSPLPSTIPMMVKDIKIT